MKRKNGECIGNYKIASCLRETRNAYIYRVVLCEDNGKESSLPYVIKQYKDGMQDDKERIVTQHIESCSPDSIVIPILHGKWDEQNKSYAVMQSKEVGGYFLSELILKLEEKYSKKNIPVGIQLEILEKLLYSVKSLHECLVNDEKYEGYLHLDLHPGNIFFESVDIEKSPIKLGAAKFIDFYNALPVRREDKKAECDKNDCIGITSGFSAPELDVTVVGPKRYTFGADLYSVSAIAARMYTGESISDMFDSYENIIRQWVEINTDNPVVDQLIKRFIECGLEYNVLYRYSSAAEMLNILGRIKECDKNKESYYKLFECAYQLGLKAGSIDVSRFKLNMGAYEKSIRLLDEALHSYNIDKRKMVYIFELLWKMLPEDREKVSKDGIYKLISSGIASNNHIAKTERVVQLCDELDKYKTNMPIMDYLDVVNRCAVSYADLFKVEKAYDMVKKNVELLQKIKEAYGKAASDIEMNGEASSRMIVLGRSYSATACYGAMLGIENEPMEMFEKALHEFGEDNSNQKITMSHILHYAVEKKDFELFKTYAEKYFNNDTKKYFSKGDNGFKCIESVYDDCVKKIGENISTGKNNNSLLYELYIIVKAIYIFYKNSINDELVKSLFELIRNKDIEKIADHPLQLIYKYAGLIFYEYYNSKARVSNCIDEVNNVFMKSMCCIENAVIDLDLPLNILMLMTYQTMEVYNRITGQTEENEELLVLLKEHAKNSGWKELESRLEQSDEDGHKLENLLSLYYS